MSNPNWLDLSGTSNRYVQMYVKGFVDVSGGNITLRPGITNNNHLIVQGGDISLNGRLFVSNDAGFGGNLHLGASGGFAGAALDIVDQNNGMMYLTEYNQSDGAIIRCRRARGTPSAPTAMQANDTIGAFRGAGYGSTGFINGMKATIDLCAAENWTDTANGTFITVRTTPVGSSALREVMRIDASGYMGLGTTNPQYKLDIATNNFGFTITGGSPTYSYFDVYTIASFTTPGTYTFTPSVSMQIGYVVVGGGGAGGAHVQAANGGSGGATAYSTLASGPTLVAGTAYTITVGAGGAGATVTGNNGGNGSASSISGGGLTITGTGGIGGYISLQSTATVAVTATGGTVNLTSGIGCPTQAGVGGAGPSFTISDINKTYQFGGGGGAGWWPTGVGYQSNLQSGGGGGSGTAGLQGNNASAGGVDGLTTSGGNGAPNTGGGGGGTTNLVGTYGGNGGSGIVILYFNTNKTNILGGMSIMSSSVGIGTTAPAYELDVNGIIRANKYITAGGGYITSGINGYITAGNGDDHSVPQKGVLRVGGHFGTGTFLQIQKIGTMTWGSHDLYNATRYISCTGNAEHTKDFNVGPGGVGIGYAPPVYSKGGADGLYVNGKVGIGTTNPSKMLTVAGDALINGLTLGRGTSVHVANTAFGTSALNANTSDNNTAFGYFALKSNIEGDANTAIGENALQANTTGYRNTAVGAIALQMNTGGHWNTAVGSFALRDNATGEKNTAVGAQAGYQTNTAGSNNTYLGYNANANADNLSNSTAIGAGATIMASNQIVLGTITEKVYMPGLVGIGTTNPGATLQLTSATPQLLMFPSSTALGQTSAILFAGTFGSSSGTTDTDARYTSQIVSGFKPTGAWGGEYLAFNVGYGGAANDAKEFDIERMRIDGYGNVGIGTTNPGFPLDIYNGTANSTNLQLRSYVNAIGTSQSYLQLVGGNYGGKIGGGLTQNVGPLMTFHTIDAGTSTEVMRMSNTNVGIGTTSPVYPLHIDGGTAYTHTSAPSATATTGSVLGVNASNLLPSSTGSYLPLLALSGNIINNNSYLNIFKYRYATGSDWFSASTRIQQVINGTNQACIEFNPPGANHGLGLYAGGSTSLASQSPNGITILQNGAVGIGTTNPLYFLDVNGGMRVGEMRTNTQPCKLVIEQGVGVSSNGLLISNTNYGSMQGLNISMVNAGNAYFNSYASIQGYTSGVSGITHLSLQPTGGNVGIGTTSPGCPLHIVGGTAYTHTSPPNVVPVTGSVLSVNTTNSLPTYTGSYLPVLMLGGSVGNYSFLNIFKYRHATGDAWTTSSTVIQQAIDGTNMAYIEFNPPGALAGLGLYTGSSGPVASRSPNGITILGNGNVGIGTTNPSCALDIVGSTQLTNTGTSTRTTSPNTTAATTSTWVKNNITYTASASSVFGGSTNYAYNSFNTTYAIAADKWESFGNYNNPAGSGAANTTAALTSNIFGQSNQRGEWLQIQTSVPAVMTSYSLASSDVPARLPKTFWIVGSNDGTNWYLIQTASCGATQYSSTAFTMSSTFLVNSASAQTSAGSATLTTTTNGSYTTNAYTYFRLIVLSIFSTSQSVTNIAEWNINFTPSSSSVPLSVDNATYNQLNVGGSLGIAGSLGITGGITPMYSKPSFSAGQVGYVDTTTTLYSSIIASGGSLVISTKAYPPGVYMIIFALYISGSTGANSGSGNVVIYAGPNPQQIASATNLFNAYRFLYYPGSNYTGQTYTVLWSNTGTNFVLGWAQSPSGIWSVYGSTYLQVARIA
jgi:hypothetical protein